LIIFIFLGFVITIASVWLANQLHLGETAPATTAPACASQHGPGA
jgi:hypothetical protein